MLCARSGVRLVWVLSATPGSGLERVRTSEVDARGPEAKGSCSALLVFVAIAMGDVAVAGGVTVGLVINWVDARYAAVD